MRKRFVDVAYAFFFQHLWLLTGLCLLTTLIGVLWGCIHNGHLPPEFPSPSDTGVFQPEVPLLPLLELSIRCQENRGLYKI
jgi:hypothetical protein